MTKTTNRAILNSDNLWEATMPTNLPIFWKFRPLTIVEMVALDGVLEGTLTDVGNLTDGYEALVLDPKDREQDGVAYTHPTLFFTAADFEAPTRHIYEVRVSLESDKLHLQFMNPGFNGIVKDAQTFVSAPVKLTDIPMSLVLKLNEMTSYTYCRCAMMDNCNGALASQLDTNRTALVLTDRMLLAAICRRCFKERLPPNWTVLLKGWELPPRAPVLLWDIPETKVVKP